MRIDIKWLTGIVLGILGLLLPIILAVKSTTTKEFTYKASTLSALENLPDKLLDNVKIVYNEEELSNLNVAFVEIKNSGTVPIPRNDFDSDIHIELIGDIRVLNAQTGSTVPASLQAQVTHEGKLVRIAPMLWNPGDAATLHILLNGEPERVDLRARIAGIREITREELKDPESSINYAELLLGGAGAFFYGFFGGRTSRASRERRKLTLSMVLEIAAALCLALLSAIALREALPLSSRVFQLSVALPIGVIACGVGVWVAYCLRTPNQVEIKQEKIQEQAGS